jgi:uncharacterized protein YndB with AHSA1/START domain
MTACAENGWELSVTRHIAAPVEIVWTIMTQRVTEWWCPLPWTTEIVEQDWRAGGRSALVMHGPDGEKSGGEGVFLEVTLEKRFVFTDAFAKVGGNWLPQNPFMIGGFEISPEKGGTHYYAWARHWDEAACERHIQMGFTSGWTAVADQLAALAEAEVAA